jgi:hypothetical protein
MQIGHDFFITFLALVREIVDVDPELWHEVNQGIDAAFGL